MSNNKPLRRGVDGICTRSTCECEREGLGDQCVWLKPAEAEFECLGEPSLCDNPRGCACAPDPTLKPDIAALKKRLAEDPGFAAEVTGDKPPAPGCHTPEGCRENGCLGWCDEHRPEASAGVEDLQREVARLKVENARLAEETMRLQRLLNAAHQIVGELAARKHAEAEARRPLRVIQREARRRAGFTPCSADPKWQAIVGRCCRFGR